MNKKGEQYPISQQPIRAFRQSDTIQDNMFHETHGPLGNSFPSKYMRYAPVGDTADQGKCLLGANGCVPLCSGYTNNPCNVVAPIPGPQWQVQSAATVQQRLTNQQYTANTCPLGPTVLRNAPQCTNIGENDSRQPQQVTCYASQQPPVWGQ